MSCTCYYCGAKCSGQYWMRVHLGKVEVLAGVCKLCLRQEVTQ